MNVIHDDYLARTIAQKITQSEDNFSTLARLEIGATQDAGDGETHFLALREETLYEVTRSETDPDEVRVSPLTDLYSKIEHLTSQAMTARDRRADLDLGEELLDLQATDEELASYLDVLCEVADLTVERAEA